MSRLKLCLKAILEQLLYFLLCVVQWTRVKRVKWLGHIIRESELSLVRQAVLTSHARGDLGTRGATSSFHASPVIFDFKTGR